MSALGSLVVKLALNHAEYTQGLSKTDQAALKFAQNSQRQFDRAERAAKQAFKNMALGAAGVVASLVGVNQGFGKIKGIIDFQDEIGKLSQKTGLAVESLAGLDFAASQSGTSLETTAKGVRSFSRIVADSSGALNKNSEILRALGIDLEDLKSKTPEDQFFALADAVQDLGEQDRAVAVTSLLGDRMADLVPLLSGGSDRLRSLVEEGQKYNPVTAESAARAEVFNDNLDRLSRSSGVLAQELTIGLVSSLSEVTAEMAGAAEQGGILQGVLVGLGSLAKTVGLASLGPIGALIAGRSQIEDVNSGISQTAEDIKEVTKQSDKASPSVRTFAQTLADIDKTFTKTSRSTKTLTKEQVAQERETESLKRDIEKLTRAYDPLIERNERLAKLNQKLAAGLPREIFDAEATIAINKAEDAINNTGTAVDDLVVDHENLRDTARSVFGDIDQFGIQAARSIQTAFASFLSGTESDFERTFRNIAGQVSSNAVLGGLENVFNGKTLGGGDRKDAGFSGIFSDLLGVNKNTQQTTADIAASSEVTAAWLSDIGRESKFSVSGFGNALSNAASVAFSNANPTAGALTVAGGNVIGSSGTATALAGAAATFGGPIGIGAGAAILAIDFLDKKFGDFELGATGKRIRTELDIATLGASQTTRLAADFLGVPDIPTLILKSILGQGPFKFRNETLFGEITSSGFEGILNNLFKSSGSLLRGSRKDNIIINTDTGEQLNNFGPFSESGVDDKQVAPFIEGVTEKALSVGRILDETITGFVGSLSDVADNMNLSKSVFDDFSVSVDLVSKKGERLTEDQFTKVLADAADTLSTSLIPEIRSFAEIGESAFEAIQRLSGEMDVLVNTFQVLGNTSSESRTELLGLSLEARSNLVEMAGGVEILDSNVRSFFNILPDTEKLRILSEDLLSELAKVEVFAIPTIEEFVNAMQSGALTLEQIAAGFDLTDDIAQFNELKTSIDSAANSADNLAQKQLQNVNDAFNTLQTSVDTDRNRLTNEYNEAVQETSKSISTLATLSNALKTSIESINPISLPGARGSIRDAIAQATTGNVVELSSVRSALLKITDGDTSTFRTESEFLRSQEENASLLDELSGITDSQLSAQELSLETLQIGFDGELARLDSIINGAQEQINLLQGIDNSIQSLGVGGSLADFNTLSVAAGGSAIAGAGGSLPFNGNRNITGALIQDFLAVNDNPFDIYNAARDNNVSGLQLAANSPFTIEQINQFADDNGLQRLRVGTNFIPRDMPAFLHQGEEVKPRAFVDGERAERKQLIGLMKKVLTATEVSTVSNNKVKKTLDKWEKVGMPKERAA